MAMKLCRKSFACFRVAAPSILSRGFSKPPETFQQLCDGVGHNCGKRRRRHRSPSFGPSSESIFNGRPVSTPSATTLVTTI